MYARMSTNIHESYHWGSSRRITCLMFMLCITGHPGPGASGWFSSFHLPSCWRRAVITGACHRIWLFVWLATKLSEYFYPVNYLLRQCPEWLSRNNWHFLQYLLVLIGFFQFNKWETLPFYFSLYASYCQFYIFMIMGHAPLFCVIFQFTQVPTFHPTSGFSNHSVRSSQFLTALCVANILS